MTDGSGASGQSLGPGLPEDTDWSLFGKLAPALGEGFAGPEAVAGVVAMLASEDGRFITGTEVRSTAAPTSEPGAQEVTRSPVSTGAVAFAARWASPATSSAVRT
jgi:hypothetical protein